MAWASGQQASAVRDVPQRLQPVSPPELPVQRALLEPQASPPSLLVFQIFREPVQVFRKEL